MILGADGERLSKRHGAVSVMHYRDQGYLPEALINYLARLGWSHGDEEIFSREQLVEWFDLAAISRSPAKFNPEKLTWLNQHYLKMADDARLVELVMPFLLERNYPLPATENLLKIVNLLKDRASTIEELADASAYFSGRSSLLKNSGRSISLPKYVRCWNTWSIASHRSNGSGRPFITKSNKRFLHTI